MPTQHDYDQWVHESQQNGTPITPDMWADHANRVFGDTLISPDPAGGMSPPFGGNPAAGPAANTYGPSQTPAGQAANQALGDMMNALAAGNREAFLEAQRRFNESLVEQKREFDLNLGQRQSEQRQGQQQFGLNYGANLLGTAASLRGPQNYFQYAGYTGGGRDLMSALASGQPMAAFQAPSGYSPPASIQKMLEDLGIVPPSTALGSTKGADMLFDAMGAAAGGRILTKDEWVAQATRMGVTAADAQSIADKIFAYHDRYGQWPSRENFAKLVGGQEAAAPVPPVAGGGTGGTAPSGPDFWNAMQQRAGGRILAYDEWLTNAKALGQTDSNAKRLADAVFSYHQLYGSWPDAGNLQKIWDNQNPTVPTTAAASAAQAATFPGAPTTPPATPGSPGQTLGFLSAPPGTPPPGTITNPPQPPPGTVGNQNPPPGQTDWGAIYDGLFQYAQSRGQALTEPEWVEQALRLGAPAGATPLIARALFDDAARLNRWADRSRFFQIVANPVSYVAGAGTPGGPWPNGERPPVPTGGFGPPPPPSPAPVTIPGAQPGMVFDPQTGDWVSQAVYDERRFQAPLPHQVNPIAWDSASPTYKALVRSAVEGGRTPSGAWTWDDYVQQMYNARPGGQKPNQVAVQYAEPASAY